MSDISSRGNHIPKMYDGDVRRWEQMVELQLDIEFGLMASRPGDIVAESMTPQDMHLYTVTLRETGYLSDPQDYLNVGELACLAQVESELGHAHAFENMRNNASKVEEI